MANSVGGLIGKSILLLLLIVALVIGGIIWFDFLGVVDKGDSLNFVTKLFGVDETEPVEDVEQSIYLLDSVRIIKEREALERRDLELKVREESIILEEAKNKQIKDELNEKEIALNDKEKSLDNALKRYEDEDKNLETTVRYLGSIAPGEAVAIMNNYPVIKVVDSLRKEDELAILDGRASLSSAWLRLMDPARGAQVQSMMIKKPSAN